VKAATPRRTLVPDRIKRARKRRSWSQERLADALGTTRQNVLRWENGKHRPVDTMATAYAISEALGVTVDFLLGDEPLPEDEDEESDPVEDLIASLRRVLSSQRVVA
jgi:transcriptional regulator with XRE-family HTH domain